MRLLNITRSSVLLGILFALTGSLQARPSLTREIATTLMAHVEDVREKEIAVGPMQRVQEDQSDGRILTGGIRVTYVATKELNTTLARTIKTYVVYHDAEWGWYVYFIEKVPGGEQIKVFTEKCGCIELR